MAPAKHSQFSASSSARLLACPGSFKLSADLDTGVRRSSVYSAEGTLAHSVAEASLFAGKEPADFIGQTRRADGFEFTIDPEFAEAAQVYVDFIRGLRAMGFIVALETVVSPQGHWSGLAPLPIDLFGTADCIAYNPVTGELVIADLKFGKGVAVDVKGNPQLRYYAAGVLNPEANIVGNMLASTGHATGPVVAVQSVRLVVVQPRAYHPDGPIRHDDLTVQEIVDWTRNDLYQGVKTALADKGTTFAPGKHCRFCPGSLNAACASALDFAYETARQAFQNAPIEDLAVAVIAADANADDAAKLLPGQPTNAELADLLDRIVVAEPIFAAVRAVAQDRMENQAQQLPGWKMVPKRALRRWADEDIEVLNLLDKTGLDQDDFSVRSLLTPAQVERRVGKAAYAAQIAPHVVKSSSGLTLAPEGDPRARVSSRTAQEAFSVTPPANPNDW